MSFLVRQVIFGCVALLGLLASQAYAADPVPTPASKDTADTLSPEEWKAQWISGVGPELPIFRKVFSPVDKPIKKAVVFVCGLGHFELSLNGAKVGNHFLDPGWTNYRKTCLYVPFDITPSVHPGRNALGVMLGNGMYNVKGGRYVKFKGSFGEPKLILQMQLDYTDGTSEIVVSDATWKTAHSPITFSCIYGGEDYDARLEQPGWDTPEFDDTQWAPAQLVEGPGGVLRVSEAPPVTVEDTIPAAACKRTGDGTYWVDLGQNLSARPFIKVRGIAGQNVKIEVSELPDAPWKGHSYTYTLKGGGEEVFRPRFTYFGFQYLFIKGVDRPEDTPQNGARPVLLEAGADFVTSSAPLVGSFQCDNDLFNDIEAMINRSVRSNLQSVLTDCPHREKLGWLEVPHLMGPSIFYHFDVSGLYRKICRDTTESQLENGMVPDIAPEYTRFSEGFFESAEWGSACVQIPWLLYRWYGDTAILERQYDTMAKYTRYLASTRNAKGLAKGGLGDWYDWTPEKGHNGYSQLTPLELTATVMLYDNARILAETARMAQRPVDEVEFASLANQVRTDFLRAYYDPKKHTVATGSQAALACGLFFGLVPDADRGAVLQNLVQAVESLQYRPTTGEVCFRFLVQSLAEAGRSDVLYRMIDRTDPPGYGCMLRKYNLKTLSEQWDKPGSSLNHCMFGHIQEWFQGYLLGIRQGHDSAGFEHLLIAPTPVGNIQDAQGYYDSPKGRIDVHWKKTADDFSLDITVPNTASASILLPVPAESTLMESGKPVQPVNTINGCPEIPVKPGTYHFICSSAKK